ncbi:MAG: hypothetical protein U0232_03370 [Thermomicrobiales bacterium]
MVIENAQLPIVLPPGSALTPAGQDAYGRDVIYALPGAEGHARHPHGIDMDRTNGLVYLIIEHSGYRWNATRSDFLPAATTDDESGMLLVFDIANPAQPQIVTGYLLGHGAHELAVNDNNGMVFQGNHENSPGVIPPNWVDVFVAPGDETGSAYHFIDTGYYNAVGHQGRRDHEPGLRDHPRRRENVRLRRCAVAATECDAGRGEGLRRERHPADGRPACALRPARSTGGADLGLDHDQAGQGCPRCCADLTVDPVHRTAYTTLHSIHHAEHTGLPGRDRSARRTRSRVRRARALHGPLAGRVLDYATQPGAYIDLSNGINILDVPNVEEVPRPRSTASVRQAASSTGSSAHWVAVGPARNAIWSPASTPATWGS